MNAPIRRTRLATLLLAAAAAPTGLAAQGVFGTDLPTSQVKRENSTLGLRNGSFILAPVPIMNPTIGTGLALGAGYLFTIDEGSDPSGIGIGGFGTDNGSRGYALGGSFNFAGGRWKLSGAIGEADLTYDFYVNGQPFEIEQTGALGRLGVAYKWSDRWTIGLDLGLIESNIGPNVSHLPPEIQPDFGITSLTADLTFGYDSRDDTLYPTSGVNAQLRAGWGGSEDDFGIDLFGGYEQQFSRMQAQYAFYQPVGDRNVVAAQIAACGVEDDTPFYLSCSLGGTDSFRGFSSTEYIDNALVSVQLAWRGRIGNSRFGYVAFAGAGKVAEDFGSFGSTDAHTAAGLGARYRVSQKFPVDFSVDVAYNDEDEITTYIYVGQRF